MLKHMPIMTSSWDYAFYIFPLIVIYNLSSIKNISVYNIRLEKRTNLYGHVVFNYFFLLSKNIFSVFIWKNISSHGFWYFI